MRAWLVWHANTLAVGKAPYVRAYARSLRPLQGLTMGKAGAARGPFQPHRPLHCDPCLRCTARAEACPLPSDHVRVRVRAGGPAPPPSSPAASCSYQSSPAGAAAGAGAAGFNAANKMPVLDKASIPAEAASLSAARVRSSIPMAEAGSVPHHQASGQEAWMYPSEQMFYAAMKRKVRCGRDPAPCMPCPAGSLTR